MSEQLDDELKRRISDVFDHHEEDTTAADEGWLLLREKFPKKEERRIIGAWFWRGMAAAVLLMLCLTGLWLQKRPAQNSRLAGKPVKAPVQLPSSNSSQLPEQQPDGTAGRQPATRQSYGFNTSPHVNAQPQPGNNAYARFAPSVSKAPNIAGPKHQSNPSGVSVFEPYLANTYTPTAPTHAWVAKTRTGIAKSSETAIVPNNPVASNAGADSTGNSNKSILAQQSSILAADKPDSVQSVIKKPSIIELFAKEKVEQAQKQKTETKKVADKKVIYSVYAATYVNYAKGSRTQPNIGAGFTSDIRLTGNLKLSTGIAIAQNRLNYSSEPVQANILNDAIRASNVAERQAAAAANAPNTLFTGLASRNVVSPVTVKSYNVSLTGLDVPVNIKYEFNPRKTDSYISAGLSSGTFINETYRYQYDNTTRNALGATTESIADASSRTGFTRFDFARTLNVAIGMGVQLGKSNRLVLEPFLKYPLDGLGSQQIRFGAGGLNLKLKFQKAKK